MTGEIERLLAGSDYFAGLTPESGAKLAAACGRRELARREHLFFEGERGTSIFILASGSIQLLKSSPDGQEIVIRTIEPGEVFGEVILFEQDTYPVTAVAVQRSRVYSLPRTALMVLLDQPQFRNDFLAWLMHRLRYLAERILYLTAYDVEERFFRFLEEQYGCRPEYRITTSKKDLAAAIGTTPETLSRLVGRLKSEGRIEWRGRTLSVDWSLRGEG